MRVSVFVGLFFLAQTICAQTVGLTSSTPDNLDTGYVLFSPIPSSDVFLIDKCGKKVHEWNTDGRPGVSTYLMPNGDLLRPIQIENPEIKAAGGGGIVQILDWDGTVKWSYTISSSQELQHHDVELLPNGNILIIVWEAKTKADAVEQGRDPNQTSDIVLSEKIIEVEPQGATGGTIVWQWSAWDHLVQDFDPTKNNYVPAVNSPDRLDINFKADINEEDWIHFNGIDYNPTLDQILLSAHNHDEIWIIDHSTTTAEAATSTGGNSNKGGDFLYRWGNPQAYGNGTESDKILEGQHNATWIPKGFRYEDQIMIFNNGREREFSSVEVINPPITGFTYDPAQPNAPTVPTYSYNSDNSKDWYSRLISGAQMLSNGNILMCAGLSGSFREIDPADNTVWSYTNPVTVNGSIAQGETPTANAVFRAEFYPADFSGFAGRNLTPGSIIENENTQSASCKTSLSIDSSLIANNMTVYPNPAESFLHLSIENAVSNEGIQLYNQLGQLVKTVDLDQLGLNGRLDISDLSNGLYFLRLREDTTMAAVKIVIAK